MDVISYNKAASAAKAAKVAQTTANSKLDSGNFVSKNGELYKLGDGFKNGRFLVHTLGGRIPNSDMSFRIAVSSSMFGAASYDNGANVYKADTEELLYTFETEDGDDDSTNHFGYSIALSDTLICIADAYALDKAGKVYVYDTDKVLQYTLIPSDGAADDYFGNSMVVNGDRLYVQAYSKVYSFNLSDGTDEVSYTTSALDYRLGRYAVSSTKVFVMDLDNDSVVSFNIDGTEKTTVITSIATTCMAVNSDTLFCYIDDDTNEIKKFNFEGTSTGIVPLPNISVRASSMESIGASDDYLIIKDDNDISITTTEGDSIYCDSFSKIPYADAHDASGRAGILFHPTNGKILLGSNLSSADGAGVITVSYGVTQETKDLKDSIKSINTSKNMFTDDIEIADLTKGIVLSSPNGTRRRLTVTDDGNIQLEEL